MLTRPLIGSRGLAHDYRVGCALLLMQSHLDEGVWEICESLDDRITELVDVARRYGPLPSYSNATVVAIEEGYVIALWKRSPNDEELTIVRRHTSRD